MTRFFPTVAFTVVAFAFGLTIGIRIGRAPARESLSTPTPSARAAEPDAGSSAGNQTWKAERGATTPPAPPATPIADPGSAESSQPSKPDSLAPTRAKEVFEAVLKLWPQRRNPEQWTRIAAKVEGVDASMSASLVDLLRGAGDAEGRQVALALLWRAGGTPLAEAVVATLEDPGAPARPEMLAALGGMQRWMYPTYAFQVDEAIAGSAHRLSGSGDAAERTAAAGILGYRDAPEARATLQTLAAGDPDPAVRGAALRSLARCGNLDTLTFLNQLPLPPGQDGSSRLIRQSHAAALAELRKRLNLPP